MDQNQLRQWEAKCTQEEPPECTASCPLHVDARLFLKEMARGDFEAAHKVLAKTMPFPGILARICDHPCEAKCKRAALDEPIAIGDLERFCVQRATGRGRMQLLPRRAHPIAVVGGGFAGICAAWDLLKKGFPVTIFEAAERLGGALRDLPAERISPEVIDKELAILGTLEAEICLEQQLNVAAFQSICTEYEAVFVDRAARGDLLAGLSVDPATGATERGGLFAGGGTAGNGTYSPVHEALQGRKGALSIERYVQGVQLETGRENDGPFQTTLHTDLAGILPQERITPSDQGGGYSFEEARDEARRCIQCECMECVKSCLFLERYQGYPKKYARQVFNNESVIFGAAHTKNQFVNSCSNCGMCEKSCPNGFNVGQMCLEARRTMVNQKFMPAAFHEFALEDLAHSSGDDFFLARHQSGASASSWVYFPSCQLCATAPSEVLASYSYLKERLSGGVAILLGCCGAPAQWAGREDLFAESMDRIRQKWEELGRPNVITACSTCQTLFVQHLPEIPVGTLWSVLEEVGLPPLAQGTGKVAIADPCATRDDEATRQSVRRIAQALGLTVEELSAAGGKPECCGYGGLMFHANPKLAADLIEHRVKPPQEIPPPAKAYAAPAGWHRTRLQEGSDTVYYTTVVSNSDYLAYCAMCRDRIAGAGKRVSHLIEHLFPAAPDADPAARGYLSWSQRRRNRALVKSTLLEELGERKEESMPEYRNIPLVVAPEVLRTMGERRILEDDVRLVLDQAERSGRRLRNLQTGGYLAYHQQGNVTFWVDYTPGADGYVIHNAYCHRMNIVGVKK